LAVTTDADGVVVNLCDSGTAKLNLRVGTAVTLTTGTRYPSDEQIRMTVDPAEPKTFAVKVRIPAWCGSSSVRVNGKPVTGGTGADGYVSVTRKWKKGDRVELRFKLEPRVVVGDHLNKGKVAVLYGPLVLAADQALLGATNLSLSAVSAAGPSLAALGVKPEPAPDAVKFWPGAQVFRVNAIARKRTGSLEPGAALQVRLIPFADAGASGTPYEVWLPLGLASSSGNVLLDGYESHSRMGNLGGSIIDENLQSFAVTLRDKPAVEDWFAVTLDEPVTISRVVFAHGKTFRDGGWFDTSGGKPRVQVKTAGDGAWEAVGELKDYPATTASDAAGLRGGECFTCQLANPIKALAVRVIGKPASGDSPKRVYASCAELQAFDGPR
jgi:hypothetical protein